MLNHVKNVKKRVSVGIGLFLFFSITLIAAISVHPVQASSTIYIRADGSIEPPAANITSLDNVTYTFTDNNYDSIVIERDHIILDGAGFTLQALSGHGIHLFGVVNVTLRNMKIERVDYQYRGIYLEESSNNTIFNVSISKSYANPYIYLYSSSHNRIYNCFFENGWIEDYSAVDNMIYNNTFVDSGLTIKGDLNWVYYNNITEGTIEIVGDYNNVYGNIVTKNGMEGILVTGESNNVTGNTITECGYGLAINGHHGNKLRENKMANNTFNFALYNPEDVGFYNDVDVSNTVDGKPIYYWDAIKNAIVPPDAGVVVLVNCLNITLRNLDLRRNFQGILLVSSYNNTILNNTLTENGPELGGGIILLKSSNNLIVENNITNNSVGIDLTESWNNTISKNLVVKNEVMGISILDSNYTVISENNLLNNRRGIRISFGSYNNVSGNKIVGPGYYGIDVGGLHTTIINNDIVYCMNGIELGSNFKKIIGNTIMQNWEVGIKIDGENNTIYHNNFVDNNKHVSFYYIPRANTWDNGYPSGGNYWSGYEDKHPNATELDNSGVWDTPYNITEANIDNYPLMAPTKPITRKFTAYSNIEVEIYSNSSMSEFQFNATDKKLSFNVTGPTGTRGFCNVTIPANLLWGDFFLFINGIPLVEGVNYTRTYNGTHYIFYITYAHSEHTIEVIGTEVIPEISSALILPVLATLAILVVILTKKKTRKIKI